MNTLKLQNFEKKQYTGVRELDQKIIYALLQERQKLDNIPVTYHKYQDLYWSKCISNIRIVSKDWYNIVDAWYPKLTERFIATFANNRFITTNFRSINHISNDNDKASFKQLIIQLTRGELKKLDSLQMLNLRALLQNDSWKLVSTTPMLEKLYYTISKQSYEERLILCDAIDLKKCNTARIQKKYNVSKNDKFKKQLEILKAIENLKKWSLIDNLNHYLFLHILCAILLIFSLIKLIYIISLKNII